MKILLILCLLFSINTYSQNIPNTPKEVVQYALTALTNGEIEKLITVTENAELRKAKELLVSVGGSRQKRRELVNQYKSLQSWKIEDSDEYSINNRTIAVVNTSWQIAPSLEQTPNIITNNTKIRKVFVDYMLERFDNQWKIISRRSLNY